MYKYIYKGPNQVVFHINSEDNSNNVNEIDHFQSAQWISPPEVMWRIYSFILNEMHPYVKVLQVHLENKQPITFRKPDHLTNLVSNDAMTKSMVTWFF